MDTALSAIATLALLASLVGALLMAVGTNGFTIRVPSGPDAMGIVVFFFLSIAHWLATLLGAILVACRGVFAWIATPAGAAAILLAFATIALGVLSFLAMIASLERKPWRTAMIASLERKPWRTAAGWVGAFALPASWSLYLLILAWFDPAMASRDLWPRLVAAPFALLAIASIILVLWITMKRQAAAADRLAKARADADARDEQNRLDAIARDAQHKAELDALPDDAPLTTFITHLFIDKSDAHHALALDRIASLPDLAPRFARELTHPDPLQREYLLNYFRVAPALDLALIETLRPHIDACFTRLADDFDAAARENRADQVRHVRGMTLGLLLSAQRFNTRFEAGARRLRESLDRWPAHSRQEALDLVDRYLAGEQISRDT